MSNPRFRKSLEQGLKEAREGKAVKMAVKGLRKRLEFTPFIIDGVLPETSIQA